RGEIVLDGKLFVGIIKLQCGHAEFGVEKNILGYSRREHRAASMRPRRIRRGEAPQRAKSCWRPTCFNAATPNSAWRISRSRCGQALRSALQCGHAEFGVEKLDAAAARTDRFALQCGH